jgi:hypothetical protein
MIHCDLSLEVNILYINEIEKIGIMGNIDQIIKVLHYYVQTHNKYQLCLEFGHHIGLKIELLNNSK